MLGRIAHLVAGGRSKWIVIAAWALVAVALSPLQPKLQEEASDESDTFQARSAESTEVKELIDRRFPEGGSSVAIVVYARDGGLTRADGGRIEADARALCDSLPKLKGIVTPYSLPCGKAGRAMAPETPPSPIADDGSAALMTVVTRDDATAPVVEAVTALRERVPAADGDGLRAYVTGSAGFDADRSEAVEGIDETLLIVTVGLVLVLLLVIYRSPAVALVPLLVVGAAYVIAAGAAYGLVAAGATDISGQTTAILIVLMFGAGTDYCLLIVARYREELRRTEDRHAAMARAADRTGPAILSSGAIVVAAMLVLSLADFNATREMGPILALGIVVMMLAGVTLLPAVLAALGRNAFWPAIPRVGAERAERAPASRPATHELAGAGERVGVWSRVGRLIAGRPALTAAVALAVLALGALGSLGGRGNLDFAESFRDEPDSVRGQEIIRDRFPAGRAAPLDLVVEPDVTGDVLAKLSAVPGVDTAYTDTQSRRGDLLGGRIILKLDPFSDAATELVPQLRRAARAAAQGDTALIGGLSAETLDTRDALSQDAKLIVPLTLVLIFLILAALLRAVVAPLYLIATVLLSYGFALGAGSLVFTHLMGQPDSDPNLPTFAFIFLVALGVDYNIFLIARIREAQPALGTKRAAIAGLERTGGVITSAGLILAGTFATLMSLTMESLFQAGFTVALGLLVDTFLVRVFLVPAIAVLLGERNWWPATAAPAVRLPRRAHDRV